MSTSSRTSRASSQSQAPIPAFLQQSKADLHNIFVDLEWRQRNRLAAGTQPSTKPSQWARLTGDEVLARNRYMNVEPFANNRVKLKVAEGVNDYINASPIVLGNRRYIATQGPKDTSTSHFYRMLASETSTTAVVVMLTQTHEAGREKCFTYFPLDASSSPQEITPDPDDPDDSFRGEITLLSSEEDPRSRTTLRRMKLRTKTSRDGGRGKEGNEQQQHQEEEESWTEKEVWHLLFGGWPDFLVPEGEDRAALLEMITLSIRLNAVAPNPDSSSFDMYAASDDHDDNDNATSQAGTTTKTNSRDGQKPNEISLNPRIVHCSAGVGRSGTFIALDYLLGLLDAGEMDNVPPERDLIAETVDKLRQQRMMMVQGEGQFMFCYEVLREAWIRRWRARKG